MGTPFTHVISFNNEVGLIIKMTLQMKELGFRGVKSPARGHTVCKWPKEKKKKSPVVPSPARDSQRERGTQRSPDDKTGL